MRAWLFLVIGLLAVLLGAVWTLQGLGVLGTEGQGMTGETMWAVIGPIVAVIGLVLAVAGARGLRKPGTPPPA